MELKDVGVGAIAGALIAGIITFWNVKRTGFYTLKSSQISRDTKIAEFRQAWINALRDDIAAYIGAADLYHTADIGFVRVLGEIFDGRKMSNDEADRKDELQAEYKKQADEWRNKAEVLYWRIKMRLNPLPTNPFKAQDDAFLEELYLLLSPSRRDAMSASDWREFAGKAAQLGSELLKREWEVTKNGPSGSAGTDSSTSSI